MTTPGTQPLDQAAPTGRSTGESTTFGAVLAGAVATFGLVVSAGLVAVITAGVLQWANLPAWLDNAVPLVVLAGGLVLSGRIATDVAGRFGPWCGLGAAVLIGLIGTAVSMAGEAHGDGLEPMQIVVAVGVVMVLTSGGAWWVGRHRARRRDSTSQA
jgi:hypothetical protein